MQEEAPHANLCSFTTGVETNPGWIPFIHQEKGMMEPRWGICCAPALEKLPSHPQSPPMNRTDGAGASLISLRICLGLALIDSELSFHSPEGKNKINFPALTPVHQFHFQGLISLDSFLALSVWSGSRLLERCSRGVQGQGRSGAHTSLQGEALEK